MVAETFESVSWASRQPNIFPTGRRPKSGSPPIKTYFADTTTEWCNRLKSVLLKHCFPQDVEPNLTQQDEKHETAFDIKTHGPDLKQLYKRDHWQEEKQLRDVTNFDSRVPVLFYLLETWVYWNWIFRINRGRSGKSRKVTGHTLSIKGETN